MAKKIVTLYIDDTSLRLMVTDGKKIKEWVDGTLEEGLVKDNVVIKEAEVAAKIRQMFKTCKVKTTKVAIGVSGFHCLSRPISFPQLPKEMLGEAVSREAKRVLPVPPEQLYISWQAVLALEGKTQVFLVAVPRSTADALFRTLHQAGLKPYFMEIKPLLLARVVKEATAVIVDVQKVEFDIVVMVDGMPQPIRSVVFPSEAQSSQEKLTVIKNELSRTITFYNSNNPEKPLASSVPIIVSGEIAGEPESCQALLEAMGHPVQSMSSPLEYPPGFTPSLHMANIGLALQNLLTMKEAGASVANINVLPVSYQPKPVSLVNIGAVTGIAVAAGLVALMLILTQSVSADIASTDDQLKATEQLIRQKTAQRQQLTNNVTRLENEINQMETTIKSLTTAFSSLEKQSTGISRDLDLAMTELPYSINVTGIIRASNTLTVDGRAQSHAEVLQYVAGLGSSGRFSEIVITGMSRVTGVGLNFSLLGNLNNPKAGVSSAEVVIKSLPANVILSGVTYSSGMMRVSGRAASEEELLLYLHNLDASDKFAKIDITNRRVAGGVVDFTLAVVLKEGI